MSIVLPPVLAPAPAHTHTRLIRSTPAREHGSARLCCARWLAGAPGLLGGRPPAPSRPLLARPQPALSPPPCCAVGCRRTRGGDCQRGCPQRSLHPTQVAGQQPGRGGGADEGAGQRRGRPCPPPGLCLHRLPPARPVLCRVGALPVLFMLDAASACHLRAQSFVGWVPC